MFGGVGYMLNGNMVAGVFRGELLLRVGKERNGEALEKPGAHPMVMHGRSLTGYVMVNPDGLDQQALADWIDLALGHVRTLPPKAAKPNPKRKPGNKPGKSR